MTARCSVVLIGSPGEHPIAQRLDAGLARELEERRHRILR